jgi:hypothetical protein
MCQSDLENDELASACYFLAFFLFGTQREPIYTFIDTKDQQ